MIMTKQPNTSNKEEHKKSYNQWQLDQNFRLGIEQGYAKALNDVEKIINNCWFFGTNGQTLFNGDKLVREVKKLR